jgi:alkylation response protein AidB-like acyl-CoA dehydrogenase
MDFDLSEEQTMLKDSVERLLKDQYGFEARGKYRAGDTGFSEKMWNQYAELGLLALPFAEEDGGIGGGATETMIVMEAFGKALILEPFFASVILAGGVLRHAGSSEQKSAHIPGIADGSLTMALACAEPQGRYDLFDVETSAKKMATAG